MNKFLKFLLYTIGGIAVLVIALGLFAKKNYLIERTIEIKAPREVVYEQMRLFKNHDKWSPWAGLDDNMRVTISANDGQIGATYDWEGNEDVGKGRRTLVMATPDSMRFEVHRMEPWDNISPEKIWLNAKEDSLTHVTWQFDMHVGFPWNGLSMFTDMNAAIGKDLERGLGNLKKRCERLVRKRYNGLEVEELEIPVKYYLGYRDTIDSFAVMDFYRRHIIKVSELMDKYELDSFGPPTGLFWTWADGKTETAAAYPLEKAPKITTPATDSFAVWPVGGGKAISIDFLGHYSQTIRAHYAMDLYMTEKKLQMIPPILEEYHTDTITEPDTSKWLTRIIYFVEPAKPDSVAVKK